MKAYNGLRLANQLNKAHEDVEVRIFLMADAASCANARGLKNAELIEGTEISTMTELTEWVADSNKVLTF